MFLWAKLVILLNKCVAVFEIKFYITQCTFYIHYICTKIICEQMGGLVTIWILTAESKLKIVLEESNKK